MKINSYTVRFFAMGFLLTFFFVNNLFAREVYPDAKKSIVNDPPPRIIITNWLNSMNCVFPNNVCLGLAADNLMVFRIKVRCAVDDLSPFPSMRIKYQYSYEINGVITFFEDFTKEITNNMLTQVTLNNGSIAYEAAFDIKVDLAAACLGQANFDVEIGHQLIDGFSSPYPISSYPKLFPANIFDIPQGGQALLHTEAKDICCFNPDDVPNNCHLGTARLSGNSPKNKNPSQSNQALISEVENNISIYPNPFSATITAQYPMLKAGEMRLFCIDAQGRIIEINQYQHALPGSYDFSLQTSSWPSGVYFLRFQTDTYTQTHKLIKL